MFVPRSLSKKAKTSGASNSNGPGHSFSSIKPGAKSDVIETITTINSNDKGKDKAVDSPASKNTDAAQELASLLELSLSNYSLWCSPELRMIVETREEGWLSLAALLRHSPLLQDISYNEQNCAQALSAHGTGYLEVQMALSSRSSVDYGLYNVRRNDWPSIPALELASCSEEYWDARTIYVEYIPPPHRTHTHAITQFLQSMLSSPSIPFYVEGLSFPAREGSEWEEKKCRGFAFVICGTIEEAEQAASLWSWGGISARVSEVGGERAKEPGPDGDMRIMARKCGFRVLPKARWSELKAEYFKRRQEILALNSRTGSDPEPARIAPIKALPSRAVVAPMAVAPAPKRPHNGDGFPRGCLLFVRNLHPETNKTTLKKLLAQAFNAPSDGSELTYVDFMKGADSCHIRIASSSFAPTLTKFFSAQRLVQTGALDDQGASDGSGQPIQVEIVEGRREEIYWEKVPEKTRLAAMVLAEQSSGGGVEDVSAQHESKKRKKW
ncbi:hypothetical protein FRB93_011582 [Tulasnella sp. JGI-2019a]|nr:hypothetical protein FRB93_011582 [Tulasnella sp. JGI-2019a]